MLNNKEISINRLGSFESNSFQTEEEVKFGIELGVCNLKFPIGAAHQN